MGLLAILKFKTVRNFQDARDKRCLVAATRLVTLNHSRIVGFLPPTDLDMF